MHKHHVELDTLICDYLREHQDQEGFHGKLMAETSITDLFMWSIRKDKGESPAIEREGEKEKSITVSQLQESIRDDQKSAEDAIRKGLHGEAYNYLRRAHCFRVVANNLQYYI